MDNGTKWIGFKTLENYDESDPDRKFGAPAAYLRKSFVVKRSVFKAVLRCTALGIYCAFVNGKQLDGFLNPGFTDYGKRLYCQTYDVTRFVVGGDNVVGAVVGDGWYTGNVAMVRRQRFGNYPLKLKLVLKITYHDGSEETVQTDETWRATTGAIRENDILNGERKDNRLPHEEIFRAEFRGELKNVEVIDVVKTVEYEEFFEPVRPVEKLSAKILKRRDKYCLFDFKQNFAGVVKLAVCGTRGQTIRIRHAEMLDDDGNLYVENYRSAENTDELVLGGQGVEEYMPSMTYHGYRYAELSSEQPFEVKSIVSYAIHNDLKRTGHFKCSSHMVNQIYKNAYWGQLSNFVSIPTDCPQRDERLGWLADAHLFATSASYNMDCRKFYEKFLFDVADSVNGDGVPDYAPFVDIFGRANAGWADCAVLLPYDCYKMYGDKNILEKFLPLMRAHIETSLATTEHYIRGQSAYSDWLNINDETAPDLFATSYLYHSLDVYSEVLKILSLDNGEIRDLCQKVKTAYCERFVTEEGKLSSDTQTAYLLGYAFHLVNKDFARRNLIRKLKQSDVHLTTGFNGCKYLLPVLSELGLDEYAYTLITNDDYASWGYSVKNGATTIWERWNSYTTEHGFGDASMNSFNHYSFGSCVEWLYGYMLGIRPLKNGFDGVMINPHFDPKHRITSASGSYQTDHGKIDMDWSEIDGKYSVKVKTPAHMNVRFDFNDMQIDSFQCKKGCYQIKLREKTAKNNVTICANRFIDGSAEELYG